MSKTILGVEVICEKCGSQDWTHLDDYDNGDWIEASYVCNKCEHLAYVELPD